MPARIKLPARSKYRAKPQIVDGMRFASKKEANRFCELKLQQKAGLISGLRIHPSWSIHVNNVPICRYEADFSYQLNGDLIVEDCKGYRTPVYTLKKKLMLACNGILIKET